MFQLGDALKRGTSTGVMLLMLTLSFAVPLMERADQSHAPVVESTHDPASCPPGHDHTVCTQVGANLLALADADTGPTSHADVAEAAPHAEDLAHAVSTGESQRSRAPPLI